MFPNSYVGKGKGRASDFPSVFAPSTHQGFAQNTRNHLIERRPQAQFGAPGSHQSIITEGAPAPQTPQAAFNQTFDSQPTYPPAITNDNSALFQHSVGQTFAAQAEFQRYSAGFGAQAQVGYLPQPTERGGLQQPQELYDGQPHEFNQQGDLEQLGFSQLNLGGYAFDGVSFDEVPFNEAIFEDVLASFENQPAGLDHQLEAQGDQQSITVASSSFPPATPQAASDPFQTPAIPQQNGRKRKASEPLAGPSNSGASSNSATPEGSATVENPSKKAKKGPGANDYDYACVWCDEVFDGKYSSKKLRNHQRNHHNLIAPSVDHGWCAECHKFILVCEWVKHMEQKCPRIPDKNQAKWRNAPDDRQSMADIWCQANNGEPSPHIRWLKGTTRPAAPPGYVFHEGPEAVHEIDSQGRYVSKCPRNLGRREGHDYIGAGPSADARGDAPQASVMVAQAQAVPEAAPVVQPVQQVVQPMPHTPAFPVQHQQQHQPQPLMLVQGRQEQLAPQMPAQPQLQQPILDPRLRFPVRQPAQRPQQQAQQQVFKPDPRLHFGVVHVAREQQAPRPAPPQDKRSLFEIRRDAKREKKQQAASQTPVQTEAPVAERPPTPPLAMDLSTPPSSNASQSRKRKRGEKLPSSMMPNENLDLFGGMPVFEQQDAMEVDAFDTPEERTVEDPDNGLLVLEPESEESEEE